LTVFRFSAGLEFKTSESSATTTTPISETRLVGGLAIEDLGEVEQHLQDKDGATNANSEPDPAVEILSFQREFATFDEFVFAPTTTTTTTTSTTLESAENEIHSVSAEKVYTELTTAEIAALDQPSNVNISSQVKSKSLQELLNVLYGLAMDVKESPGELQNRPSVKECAGKINEAFLTYEDQIEGLDEDDFETFSRAINSHMMLLTYSIFSYHSNQDGAIRFACVRRKVQGKRKLSPKKKHTHSHASQGTKCAASFLVRQERSQRSKTFELIVATHEHVENGASDSCSPFTIEEIKRNENFNKGMITGELKQRIVSRVCRFRSSDKSLRLHHLKQQINLVFKEYGLDRCPESIQRELVRKIELMVFGDEDTKTELELHSVDKLIEKLEKNNIPFQYYEVEGTLEAIYWCDPRLVDVEKVKRINKIVHDTSFGIQHPRCGLEKYSVLASMDNTGESQMLVNGVSVSDRHEYFQVMLQLLKKVYPFICEVKPLLVFSDEDRAFLKAVKLEFGENVKNFVCLWHKKQNFVKKRGSDKGVKKAKIEIDDKSKKDDETV